MTTTTLPAVEHRSVDGVRIRYADSGGQHGATVLLTSPWPESLYAFAPLWDTLARYARLVAIDRFLSALIAEADLGVPYLVAPDVGTSAALFLAAGHPESISGVIVGSGGAAVPLDLGEPLRSWVLDPDLEKYRRIDPALIVNGAVDTVAWGVLDDVRANYLTCYAGDRFVESMRYARRHPEELPVLGDLLLQITTQVTIINGRRDRVVPLSNAEFLDDRLSNSRLAIVDAGHFIWEERPEERIDHRRRDRAPLICSRSSRAGQSQLTMVRPSSVWSGATNYFTKKGRISCRSRWGASSAM